MTRCSRLRRRSIMNERRQKATNLATKNHMKVMNMVIHLFHNNFYFHMNLIMCFLFKYYLSLQNLI